jgi:glycolate oxidase
MHHTTWPTSKARALSPDRAAALLADVRAVIPSGRVLASAEDLLVNAYDGTWLEELPDVVVCPTTVDEIARVVAVARKHVVPIVPRGAGSGLAGGSVPVRGGIVVSTTRMNRIREIDREGAIAVVEPGVVNATLQAAVERVGLFYPPDPASLNQATIGGNVATSASGPRCLKYGGTKDYVVGLELVMASGEILRLGGRSHQPADDHGLIQLVVGSEGTLGIVSEVTVRLIPRPIARGTVMATFRRLEAASDAVGALLSTGIVPLALEMMDQVTLRCVEEFLRSGLPTTCEAMLLVDVDGDPESVADQVRGVVRAFEGTGAASVEPAGSVEAAQSLWRARRSTSSSFGRLRPNKLGEDISVPRSAIPTMVRSVQAIAARHALLIPLFGHIGDGNLHPNILCDLRDAGEMAKVAEAAREIFAAAIQLGGFLSGEHGIGRLKREFVAGGIDPAAASLMRAIKDSVDPMDLLNPGKVTPR